MAAAVNVGTKSIVFNNICGIELVSSAEFLPAPNGSLQSFYNTHIKESDAKPAYFGKASVSFTQEGKKTIAGKVYQQKLSLRFPNGDLLTAERIAEYEKAKMVFIKLSGGTVLLFGRNDYFQNAALDVSSRNTQNMTEITYACESIFPIGQTNGSFDHLLPEDLPVNFYNL